MQRFLQVVAVLLPSILTFVVASPSVSNLAFTDTNPDFGQLEGVISWDPPTSQVEHVQYYSVWMAYDQINTEGSSLIDKTHHLRIPVGTNQLDIWSGGMTRATLGNLPANYFVVLAYRADLGAYQDMSEAGTLEIYDSSSAVTTNQVTNVVFTDDDDYQGWVGGLVTWQRIGGQDYGGVSQFHVYFADDAGGSNLRFIKSTTNHYHSISVEMDTELKTSKFVLVYCWNPNGRASVAASAPINDLALRTRTSTSTITHTTTVTMTSTISTSSTVSTSSTTTATTSSATSSSTSASTTSSTTVTTSATSSTTATDTSTSFTSSSVTTSSKSTTSSTSMSSSSTWSTSTATSITSSTTTSSTHTATSSSSTSVSTTHSSVTSTSTSTISVSSSTSSTTSQSTTETSSSSTSVTWTTTTLTATRTSTSSITTSTSTSTSTVSNTATSLTSSTTKTTSTISTSSSETLTISSSTSVTITTSISTSTSNTSSSVTFSTTATSTASVSTTTTTTDCARHLAHDDGGKDNVSGAAAHFTSKTFLISFNLSTPLKPGVLIQAGLLQVLLPPNVSHDAVSIEQLNLSDTTLISIELLVSESSSPSYAADTLFRYFSCLSWILLPGASTNGTDIVFPVGQPQLSNISEKDRSREDPLNFVSEEQELAAGAVVPVLAIAVFVAGGAGTLFFRTRRSRKVHPESEDDVTKVKTDAIEEEISKLEEEAGTPKNKKGRAAELLKELKMTRIREQRLRRLSAMSLQKLLHQETKQFEILTEVHDFLEIHDKLKEAVVVRLNGQTLETFFQQLPSDGSGSIEQDELEDIMRTRLRISKSVVTDEELEFVFGRLDSDGSGSIDIADLIKFLKSDKPMGYSADILQDSLVRLSVKRPSLAWQEGDSLAEPHRLHKAHTTHLDLVVEPADEHELAERQEVPQPRRSMSVLERHKAAAARASRASQAADSSSAKCGSAPRRVQPMRSPTQASLDVTPADESVGVSRIRPCRTSTRLDNISLPGTPDGDHTTTDDWESAV